MSIIDLIFTVEHQHYYRLVSPSYPGHFVLLLDINNFTDYNLKQGYFEIMEK